MLLFKIITHPAVVLASIGIVVIAGEASAGIFLQFFVMNLLTMNLFAVVCAIGLVILFFSFMIVGKQNMLSHSIMNVSGILLIMLSVYLFFYWLPWENSYQSFTTFIPLCTVILAGICSTAFLARNIVAMFKRTSLF